jgi:sugar phosphate isomerase/epimerase
MIALSTAWGRDAFGSPLDLFRAFRETFPAFEIASVPWLGRPADPRADLRAAGVRGASWWHAEAPDDAFNPAGGDPSRRRAAARLAEAARAAKAAGLPRLCFLGGFVPRVEGWDGFRRAVRGAGASGDEARRGFEHRGRAAEHALENLARTLFEACRAEPDVLFCLETPEDPSGLPGPSEIAELARAVGARNLRYAHSAGRAAFLQSAAGWPPEAWIDAAGPFTEALVLDDGAPAGPGRMPGTGSADYRGLRAQAPSGALGILRPPPEASEAEVRAAGRLLAAAGF